MLRVVVTLLLVASPSLAQGVDPCTMKCGESMGGCTDRCGADQRCTKGCVRDMDDCNTKCLARGKAQFKPRDLPRMCPGQGGKMIPCAEMTEPRAPPKKKSTKSATYPNQAGKDLMKK